MDITIHSFELNTTFVKAQETTGKECNNFSSETPGIKATFRDIINRIIETGQYLDTYV